MVLYVNIESVDLEFLERTSILDIVYASRDFRIDISVVCATALFYSRQDQSFMDRCTGVLNEVADNLIVGEFF